MDFPQTTSLARGESWSVLPHCFHFLTLFVLKIRKNAVSIFRVLKNGVLVAIRRRNAACAILKTPPVLGAGAVSKTLIPELEKIRDRSPYPRCASHPENSENAVSIFRILKNEVLVAIRRQNAARAILKTPGVFFAFGENHIRENRNSESRKRETPRQV